MKYVFILLLFNVNFNVFGQYIKLDLLRIDTKFILQENYSQLFLQDKGSNNGNLNKLDLNCADNFIEILQDPNHKRAHILIQTNFFGEIQYVAVSNNIFLAIDRKDKPKFIFNKCLSEVRNGVANAQENIDKIINCILNRLEDCINK